jgi:hypothetical protein
MLLASITEEYHYARQCEPDFTCTHQSTLEQGQINWSQAAAQAEDRPAITIDMAPHTFLLNNLFCERRFL